MNKLFLKKIGIFTLLIGMVMVLVACGEENNEGNDGGNKGSESGDRLKPEIVVDGSNPFLEPMDIVDYFLKLQIIETTFQGDRIEYLYEVLGEENVDGISATKIHIRHEYEKEDPFSPSPNYDFWMTEGGEIVQVFSYHNDIMLQNPANFMDTLEGSIKPFLEPFTNFDENYREAIVQDLWSIREMEVENTTIAGHTVDVYTFNGKHDVTFDDENEFMHILIDFGDFEFNLESEDNTAFGPDLKFEIVEMEFR